MTNLKTVSVTKALVAAGDYADEDVLSESVTVGTAWIFNGVAATKGASAKIIKAQAIWETTGLTPTLTLYLFTSVPTSNLNDNIANTALLHADLANYVGRIDFPAMDDKGGDSESIVTSSLATGNLPLPFTAATGDDTLYGVLVLGDNEAGEVAGEDMTVSLTVES